MSDTPTRENEENKTLLVRSAGTEQVVLVVAIVLSPEDLNIERILSGLIPEMARGGVRGGLLLVGDSTLVLRNDQREILVDEVSTVSLLGLAPAGCQGRDQKPAAAPPLRSGGTACEPGPASLRPKVVVIHHRRCFTAAGPPDPQALREMLEGAECKIRYPTP